MKVDESYIERVGDTHVKRGERERERERGGERLQTL